MTKILTTGAADRKRSALPQQFREAMARVAASVAVICVRQGQQIYGATISSMVSISAEPPVLMFSLRQDSSVAARIVAGFPFGASVLADGQEPVARALAQAIKPPLDIALFDKDQTTPLLHEACARFVLCLRQELQVEAQRVLFADVLAVDFSRRSPLLYQMRGYRSLGFPEAD